MWNPFKKSTHSLGAAAPANRVDALTKSLQSEGHLDKLEEELEKLGQDHLSLNEQTAWWHTYGIVAFRGGRDAEAMQRFQEG